jgi:ribosomal protein S12 methylthiotransferase accessory factor YcaO
MVSKSSSIPPLSLNSIKKYRTEEGDVTTRVRSAEDTLEYITPVGKKIGVTRLCDITYLDRLYIPNFSAILPGTDDLIWVYGGKGPTKVRAMASAFMESIERYCSLYSANPKKLIRGTYSELSRKYNKVLHPDEVVEPVEPTYDDTESILDFVTGFDIINEEQVLVPAQLAFSRFFAKSPSVQAFPYSHTNGLASGNVLEEAICHALCEVIERDAASIADLCASSIPYSILEGMINLLKKENNFHRYNFDSENNFVDDSSIFPEVDITKIAEKFQPLNFLVQKFADAEISLLVKDITQQDIGIPTFVASSVESITSDYGYFAIGYGSHLDARIALVRAITELSQTRAANIQGARDDLKKIRYKENDEIYKRKWQFMPSTTSNSRKHKKNSLKFSEIKTYVKDDILDDIKFILSRLKKSGIKRAIIVDLTNPKIGVPVVRAIVPGFETFEVARLFTSTRLFMGYRAKEHFRNISNI